MLSAHDKDAFHICFLHNVQHLFLMLILKARFCCRFSLHRHLLNFSVVSSLALTLDLGYFQCSLVIKFENTTINLNFVKSLINLWGFLDAPL